MVVSTQQASGNAGSTNIDNAGPNLSYSQGGGKTKTQQAMNSVVQVNPSKMTELLASGTSQQNDYFNKGLQYYKTEVQNAANSLQAGYATGNSTLAPLSIAGQQALAEQMKMLGLKPISLTAGFANKLNAQAPDPNDPNLLDLQDKLIRAEGLTNSAERTSAKNSILSQMRAYNKSYDPTGDLSGLKDPDTAYWKDATLYAKFAKEQNDALIAQGKEPLGISPYSGMSEDVKRNFNYLKSNDVGLLQQEEDGLGPVDEGRIWAAKNRKEVYDNVMAGNDVLRKSIEDKKAANVGTSRTLQNFINEYDTNYSTDDYNPYTGEQVGQKLASSPGYLAQMAAGTNAISRQAAASGMLGSGNAYASLLRYGQTLASDTFANYMGNLSNISGLGSNALGVMAGYQTQLGEGQAQLQTGLGAAGMQTNQGIGGNIYQGNSAQAGMLSNTAQFNAAMQYNSKQANLNRSAAANMSAMQSAPGMMNAATNAAQFGYEKYNNEQMAKAFAANQPFRPSGYWQV